MAESYYKILGLPTKASAEEIKRAYRKQAKRWHPDLNSSSEASSQFVRINEAYEILSDPRKRAVYDNKQRVRARDAAAMAGRRQQRPHLMKPAAELPGEGCIAGPAGCERWWRWCFQA